jgi:hypothetical protein
VNTKNNSFADILYQSQSIHIPSMARRKPVRQTHRKILTSPLSQAQGSHNRRAPSIALTLRRAYMDSEFIQPQQ